MRPYANAWGQTTLMIGSNMNWLNDLKELIFPRYCKVCGRRLMHSEQHLCINCLLELPRTHYEREPNNLLMQHFMEWPEVMRATAYFYYYKEGKYRQLIHHLKYYDHPEVGTYLGRLAATELKTSGFFDGIDLIVPDRYPRRNNDSVDTTKATISLGASAKLPASTCAPIA